MKSDAGRHRRLARKGASRLTKAEEAVRKEQGRLNRNLLRAARIFSAGVHVARLKATPITQLKQVGVKGVRWTALQEAGITNLSDLSELSDASLESIRGVGPCTADAVKAGASSLTDRILGEPVPLPGPADLDNAEAEALIGATWSILEARAALSSRQEKLFPAAKQAKQMSREGRRGTSFLSWCIRRIRDQDLAVLAEHAARIETLVSELRAAGLLTINLLPWVAPASRQELARDLEVRYSDYLPLLERCLGSIQETDGLRPPAGGTRKVPMGMPREVAARVQAHPLDTAGLRVLLRRYQEFGARYLLCQERTLLGDEMGLGKTIVALAAMNHLAKGTSPTRFLVICPASIVPNWICEIEARTQLKPRLAYGAARNQSVRDWLEKGGVAVTSFASLRNTGIVRNLLHAGLQADLTVVDEAHYVKNPQALRTQAVSSVLQCSKKVSLMTGTPLENSAVEFSNLIRMVSPRIATALEKEIPKSPQIGPLVAPVYLRRNQEDVLHELPERINVEERVVLSASDLRAYRSSLESRNYMALRRSTALGSAGEPSAKVQRLLELIEEYRAEGRKVLIFSYFLDVLDDVAQHVPHTGILRGAVSPGQRMELVRQFQAGEGHSVLLAQIMAGGVGLNIQAASVVVLMEPQWKPSTEEQAIARAHRMGQTRTVVVHRLLARDTVDERLFSRMAEKQELFDEHVRGSELKDAAPEASEASFARAVIEDERRRLAMTSP